MSRIRSFATRLRKSGQMVSEFALDMAYYLRHSGISPFQDANRKLFYKIIIETHAIEKGLSLREPRPLFGRDKIRFIMAACRRYDRRHSLMPVSMATGALSAYGQLHRERGIDDPLIGEIEEFVAEMAHDVGISANGGLRQLDQPAPNHAASPHDFLASRFSCRMFRREALPRDVIERLVAIAQSAPSQCNRQATHLHCFQDRARIDSLLRLQAGSAGFAEDVPCLFVVSTDFAAWGGPQQRHQGFVDGALFAMSLMLSLHGAGIASCPLNLAVDHRRERDIRRVAGIPEHHRLVMMIAAGFPLARTVKAARSPRRDVAEILRFGDAS
jgi:nitroreductase